VGVWWSVLELDLFKGRRRVAAGIIGGDGLQDLKQFGTVGGAVQQGSSEVSSHEISGVVGFAGSL
jgi:hypothetical protein